MSMKLEQYLSNIPHINDSVNPETGEYSNTKQIEFGNSATPFWVTVKIAHVGNKEWAFGYEIHSGVHSPIVKLCCVGEVVKGDIEHLLYGLAKAMMYQIDKQNWLHKQSILEVLSAAIRETKSFIKGKRKHYKITL